MGKTIVISNQKGGCGKSVTAANLGIGLARKGGRVLLLDLDSQHSLTISLGITEPEKLPVTTAFVIRVKVKLHRTARKRTGRNQSKSGRKQIA